MADLKTFFAETLPKKLENNPDLVTDINASYQFDLEGAGTWTVDLTQEGGEISEGPTEDPGCVVTAKADDFAQMLDNPASAMMLFTMGKLKVSNVGLAISLQKLLG